MALKIWLFLFMAICPLSMVAQTTSHILVGKVFIKNGPTCNYQVNLKINGNTITGTSITTQPSGADLKAIINGTVDKKKHLITFFESKQPLSFDIGNCMFNVQLKYKIVAGKYQFNGVFIGRSNHKDTCDEGTATMTFLDEAEALFEWDKPVKKRPVKSTPAQQVAGPVKFEKITATVNKEFNWQSDTCLLEIWDGEVVDGDSVTIKVNGIALLSYYGLIATRKQLRIPLLSKVNTITITALNEGKAPPNTAMIMLHDGGESYGILSCIRRGESAQIIVNRKR